MPINFHQAYFLRSDALCSRMAEDSGREVAFVGRSNAGKSSALNTLTRQKKLARISKTPGRTQLINSFGLDAEAALRLVDLPGYGYAKVAKAAQARWTEMMLSYLNERASLKGLIVLMDIRHPLQDSDLQLLTWCAQVNLPVHVLLSKADKLARSPGLNVKQRVQKTLAEKIPPLYFTIQCFSALKRTGIDELQQQLAMWLREEAS